MRISRLTALLAVCTAFFSACSSSGPGSADARSAAPDAGLDVFRDTRSDGPDERPDDVGRRDSRPPDTPPAPDVAPLPDTLPPRPDSDTPTDARTDAPDTAPDAAPDTAPDAGPDAGLDAAAPPDTAGPADTATAPDASDASAPGGPVLTLDSALCNPTGPGVVLAFHGQTDTAPPARFELSLLDAAGAPLPFADDAPMVAFDPATSAALVLSWPDPDGLPDSFTGALRSRLGHPFEGVAAVHLTVVDAAGATAGASAPCTPPPPRGAGEACDPERLDDACAAGLACVVADPVPGAPDPSAARCQPAAAPTLGGAAVFVNAERRTLGVRVTAADPDGDLAAALVRLRDGFGRPLGWTDGAGAFHAFPELFVPLGAVAADPGAAPPASALPLGASGPLPAAVRDVFAVAAADVRVVDATALTSDALAVPAEPPAALPAGFPCDPYGAFGVCAAPDERCGHDDGTLGTPTYCQVPVPECPDAFGAVAATDHPGAEPGVWSVTLDLAAAAPLTEPGTCGGGGAQRVVTFAPPAPGRYRLTLTADAPDATHLRAFLRRHCAFADPDSELACADGLPWQVELALGDVPLALVLDDGGAPPPDDGAPAATATLTIETIETVEE